MNTESRANLKNFAEVEHETVRIEKTKARCPACENYVRKQSSKPVAVISCEGACVRGEIARQAANKLCHSDLPEQTVRVCLGSAFTTDGGQRNLVRNADRVLILDGCFIECGSRMMAAVIPELKAEVIHVDKLYRIDGSLFGIDELPEAELQAHARTAAAKIAETISLREQRRQELLVQAENPAVYERITCHNQDLLHEYSLHEDPDSILNESNEKRL